MSHESPSVFLWLRKGNLDDGRLKKADAFFAKRPKIQKKNIKGPWHGAIYASGSSMLRESNGVVSYWAQEGTGIRADNEPNRFLLSRLVRYEGFWVAIEVDSENSLIKLARDRLGGMALYIFRDSNNFVLSSDIKAIRASIPQGFFISRERLAGFLCSSLPPYFGPETFFENILRPQTGALLNYDLKNTSEESASYLPPFTNPALWVPPSEENFKSWTSRLRSLLRKTLLSNLGGVKNLAFELSGGVDSSVMAVELARSGMSFRTTSVTYPECKGRDPDESSRAALTAKKLGFNIHWVEVTGKDIIGHNDKLSLAYSEPISDPSLLVAYEQERVIRSLGHKSVVSGQDGDTLFGGLASLWMGSLLLKNPAQGLALWRKWRSMIPFSALASAAFIFLSPLTRRFVENSRKMMRSRASWLKVAPQIPHWYATDGANYVIYKKQHEIEEVLSLLFRWVLERAGVLKLNHYLPYINLEMTDLMDAVPTSLIIHEGYNKYLTRLAYSDELPKEVIWHRGKLGFVVPLDIWVNGPFKKEIEECVFSSTKLGEIVDLAELESRFDELKPMLRWRLYSTARFLDLF